MLMSTTSLGQSSADDSFSRLFELMEQRIQNAFGDFFSDDDNLNQMFDIGRDIFDQSPFGSMLKQDLEYEWIQEDKGRALIVKIPKDNTLDIKVKGEVIVLSGEIKKTTENKTQHGSSKSVSISSVSEALPVPKDCNGSKVKQSTNSLKGKLVTKVFFPYKNGKPGDPGLLSKQKSFDLSDLSKSFPKSFPRQTNRPKVFNKNKSQGKTSKVEEEEMIPLFEDGEGI